MIINIILLYLSVVFAFRLGAYLALYTDIKVWQMCLLCVAIKFFVVSYGIQG